MDRVDRLLRVLKQISPIEAQNRLMATPDRDIAISMLFMDDESQAVVLEYIAAVKAKRVIEELRLQERLRIRSDQYHATIDNLIARVAGETGVPTMRSYIRPKRSDDMIGPERRQRTRRR